MIFLFEIPLRIDLFYLVVGNKKASIVNQPGLIPVSSSILLTKCITYHVGGRGAHTPPEEFKYFIRGKIPRLTDGKKLIWHINAVVSFLKYLIILKRYLFKGCSISFYLLEVVYIS